MDLLGNVLAALSIVWAMHLVAASFTVVPTRQLAMIQRLIATMLVLVAFVLLLEI